MLNMFLILLFTGRAVEVKFGIIDGATWGDSFRRSRWEVTLATSWQHLPQTVSR